SHRKASSSSFGSGSGPVIKFPLLSKQPSVATICKSVLRASIEELVRGPLQGSYLNRTIPKNVEIQVSQSNGIVQLNLPSSLDELSGSTFLGGILDSLLLTVSQFPTVNKKA
ncbi:MAG: GerMN domain-containing protein, partial [Clostridium sp.]|nr:GerMN domain-containing protein [Clostridium sp.]